MPFVTIRFSPKGLAFIRQLLATLTAAWTCVGHGLLTGYTAQAIPSMSKADSRIEMTETHKNWISKYVCRCFNKTPKAVPILYHLVTLFCFTLRR